MNMRKPLLLGLLLLTQATTLYSQSPTQKLTVEMIMQDPKWIGTSPSEPYWSKDGKYLFFKWNPAGSPDDSLYYITPADHHPQKASYALQHASIAPDLIYNSSRTAATFTRDGDVCYWDIKTNKEIRISRTEETEFNPVFSFSNSRIVYTKGGNLFSWTIATGVTDQLTNLQHTSPPTDDKKDNGTRQEKWLHNDQLQLFEVLRERKKKKDLGDSIRKAREPRSLKTIYIGDNELSSLAISPDGRFITYRLSKRSADTRPTIVPAYVTETGFTRDIPARSKVGTPSASSTTCIFDTEKDTVITIMTDKLPGITDRPDYVKDYPNTDTSQRTTPRGVSISAPVWSGLGTHVLLDIRAHDNKDRWLMLLDPPTGNMTLVDRQRDEAWIAGPGIGRPAMGWIDENTCWFQSEATGYSHLLKMDVLTGTRTALTYGNYEVQQCTLSKDKKTFYIVTNEVHPGEQQFYQLPVTGGPARRITTLTGAHQVTISPDESRLAILYSYTNQPWELFLQDNKPGSKATQITDKAISEAFRAYPWRDVPVITFPASDGAIVYARIYRPASAAAASPSTAPGMAPQLATGTAGTHPAVIFVHGAGYLQNAHKWWSSYFREYMFNNLLADNGYTVLDIDYRGSAGYGRDWRTGIYRHMGGKDLSDQVDGVKYLVEHEGVDPKRIGIYGGSYGGFITLMALFTKPEVFQAGAGLRSVTDWAHYNQGYTANILNEPADDSLAYRRSSPIYFADGLKGHLLMCHGMVDENVHFQDIVRLSQRLIELHKDNWELAVYPMEDHGFVEPSSWTDEYSRIYKLFNTWLKPSN